ISLDPSIPNVISFNLGVQRELRGNMIVEVGYLGTLGRHLMRTLNINQLPVGARLKPENRNVNTNALRPYLGYGNINLQENGDTSNYHSLQISLNRRMQQGLAFGVNYTFSRTLESSGGAVHEHDKIRLGAGLFRTYRPHRIDGHLRFDTRLI